MRETTNPLKLFLVLFPTLWVLGGEPQSLPAGNPADPLPAVSCAQFLAPQRNVNGKMVGQEECQMQDAGIVDADRKYHRVEMGVTGTLSGWIVKEAPRPNHFTSAPDFLFTQFGNTGPRFHAILRYTAARGTSLTLLYPESGWNGKLFVMVHGGGGSFLQGSNKPWDRVFDSTKPFGDVTKYEKAMLEKGYAVARTRRNAALGVPGDFTAVLDDGEVWPEQNINLVPELILDEVRLVGNFLKDRLSRKPSRNYWYGHSAGAYQGLAINHMQQLNPGLNKEPDGKNTIDGFIDDDPGDGLFLPILVRNGQDILYRRPEEKANFIKTIVIAHQAYPLDYTLAPLWTMDVHNLPEGETPVALTNKRTTARIFKDKGIGGYRMYEVRGVSHNGGESLPNGKNGDVEILNLSRLMDGVIDLLDNWVEKGIEPPPTKSDAPGLSSTRDALSLPEVACPLGKYFAYPPLRGAGGVGSTGFAVFDGASLEPFDGLLRFVDMNENGKRDKRETVTEAWRRLGLLKAGETFSRAKYAACVQGTVAKLRKESFITEKVGNLYVEEARTKELPVQ